LCGAGLLDHLVDLAGPEHKLSAGTDG
jgi:hypothetical protein